MGETTAEVTIEEISSVKKKLSFEVPWGEVKKELDATYGMLSKKVKVRGFRPGKVPRNVLEMHYKKDAEDEVIQNLVSKRYANAVTDNEIFAVAQPEIDQKGIEKEKPFSFTATVETRPEFEPKDYVGLEVIKEEIETTDRDVNDRLQQTREMYATLEEVEEEKEAREGDFVVIDFEVTVEGKPRDELATDNYTLQIGSGKFVADFEEKLKGLKKGDEKTVNITFPEDYQPADLAGKEGTFRVTVKNIREKKVPELDEEFIKNFEQYETIEDLKTAIQQSLVDEAKVKIESDLKKQIIDELIEHNEFEVPSVWVEQQIYYMMLDTQKRMVSNGMAPDKAMEVSMNLREGFKEPAERLVKSSLLLAKIAEKESIKVEDKDIEDRIRSMAGLYGQDYESLNEAYDKNNMKERLREELQEDKALEYLIDKASITVKKKEPDAEEGKTA